MIARITRLIATAVFFAVVIAHVAPALAQSTPALRLIDYVNVARIENGLPTLPMYAPLSLAALLHARDMAENGFVEHTGSDGSNVGQRVTRTGYAWTLVAENVAAGQETVQEVVQGWMKSPGHKENILNEEITEIGGGHVAVLHGGTGKNYSHFWVVVFGRR
ncbi:MAG: CAP domain-containing protein [Rhodospirillales bacterium]|nr:CAP domain-containing protein [Rhodospirillales bacterium]